MNEINFQEILCGGLSTFGSMQAVSLTLFVIKDTLHHTCRHIGGDVTRARFHYAQLIMKLIQFLFIKFLANCHGSFVVIMIASFMPLQSCVRLSARLEFSFFLILISKFR